MKLKSLIFRIKKIKKFKKFFPIGGAVIGLALIFLLFFFFYQKGFSFFPLNFFQKEKVQQGGLPATPKGRVGPSPEFLEKMKEQEGKTPSGTEFKGPTSPPPQNSLPQSALKLGDFRITPSTCTKECHSCPYPLNPTLSWTFENNNYQSAFQIQIADNKSFKSSIDSGKVSSDQKQCGIPDGCKLKSPLSFNKEYWIRIKFWNSQNKETAWANYSGTYKTPLHLYPAPDFEWLPKTPQLGKEAKFTDLSKAYGGTNGKTEIEGAIKNWSWTFQDANPQYSISQNPTAIFEKTPGLKNIILTVTDKDGLYCDVQKNVSVIVPLPKYQEGY